MFDANTSLCSPKFEIGDKVISRYKDDENLDFNGEGIVEDIIVMIRYKVRFKKDKWGKFLEEDLKRV